LLPLPQNQKFTDKFNKCNEFGAMKIKHVTLSILQITIHATELTYSVITPQT